MKDLAKLQLLEEILPAIGFADSPVELLNHLIDRCIEMTSALTGSIMLINTETKVLDVKVCRGLKKEKIMRTKLRIGEGVTGRVALTGEPLLINDVDKIDYYVRVRKDLKSELAVPLKYRASIRGVISVDSDKRNAFTEENMDFLITVSNIAAQLLLKANLIEELRRKIENQNILLKIADILEESFELKDIFVKAIRIISTTIQIKRGILVLLNEYNKLKIFAGYRLSEEAIKKGVYEIGEGITGKVVKYGKSIAIKDIFRSKEFLNKMRIRRGKTEHNSFFSVPIKFDSRTAGVLVYRKGLFEPKGFR